MKDFSYLLDRKIEDIGDINEVRKRLYSTNFSIQYYGGSPMVLMPWTDPLRIMDEVASYFYENNGYIRLCQMIGERGSGNDNIHGFILIGCNSILDNEEFEGLKGLSVIGYGIDERVLTKYWINEMIRYLDMILDNLPLLEEDNTEIYFDYIWFDCPSDKIDFFKKKYEMKSLENNPNILYKFLKKLDYDYCEYIETHAHLLFCGV